MWPQNRSLLSQCVLDCWELQPFVTCHLWELYIDVINQSPHFQHFSLLNKMWVYWVYWN